MEIFSSEQGPVRAAAIVRQRRGSWFDPEIVDAFLSASATSELWDACAAPNIDERVAAAEPEGRAIAADDKRLNDIAEAFAWVIDAKSPFTYHHSERVADFATGIARELGLDEQCVVRVPVFGALAFDASAHHERLDGKGYYRNLAGEHLSPAARILATADQLDALSAGRPYRGTFPPDRVMAIMRDERGTGLCPDAVDAAEKVFQR